MSVCEAEPAAPDRKRGKRPRSAVTSGRQLFIDGDPNSAWSRRYHDLVVGHIADQGSRDMLSEARLALIRRAAAMECELEQLEAAALPRRERRPGRLWTGREPPTPAVRDHRY
jgi:hypothetical protein